MNTEITFRNATESDLPAIETLVNSTYRGKTSKKGWTHEADILDGQRTDLSSLLEMLQKEGAWILVAEDRFSCIQGCAYLEQKNNTCYLGMLTVHPEFQGQGLGKSILKECERRLQKAGCQTVQKQ